MGGGRRNPSNLKNWELRCKTCQRAWSATTVMGSVQDHFIKEHGTDHVSLDLTWVGKGPAPKTPPPLWN